MFDKKKKLFSFLFIEQIVIVFHDTILTAPSLDRVWNESELFHSAATEMAYLFLHWNSKVQFPRVIAFWASVVN
jgi:hypothetical protein